MSVFRADSFDSGSLDRRGSRFRNYIPGTAVDTRKGVLAVRRWLECVVQKGRWVRRRTPWFVPWERMHRDKWRKCDNEAVAAGGIADNEAFDVADQWWGVVQRRHEMSQDEYRAAKEQAEASWNVRETLKHVWDEGGKCGQWELRDGRHLCHLARPKKQGKVLSVVIIGDSIQREMTRSLANNMVRHIRNISRVVHFKRPEMCKHWPYWDAGDMAGVTCSFYYIDRHHELCRDASLEILYVLTDHLLISSHNQDFKETPWSRRTAILQWADVVVVNRGPHYTTDDCFRTGFRSSLRFMRAVAPDTLFIVRGAAAGHPNCTHYKGPIKKPQSGVQMPYHWNGFASQNKIAKHEAEGIGSVFLDFEELVKLRPDGHVGWNADGALDCLHYCNPGPVDTLAQLFMNLLFRLGA